MTIDGDYIRHDFDSVHDVAKTARDSFDRNNGDPSTYYDMDYYGGHSFFHVHSKKDLDKLVLNGWEEHADETYQVAESTLESVARECDMPTFQNFYAVTGSDVDVARYLSGEPENMISYQMVDTPKVGRIITIAANIAVNAETNKNKMINRGKAVAALVLAVESLGLRTELYVEMQNAGYEFRNRGAKLRQVTKVKGPEDTLDASTMLFAFAHPAFFRSLSLGAMWALPKDQYANFGVGGGHGHATNDMGYEKDYPEGTIHIPSSLDLPDPKAFVVDHLKRLGIL